MSYEGRAGDCVVRQLDDGRVSVIQADPIIDVSVDLLTGEASLSEYIAWNGRLLAIDAVEGVVMYRAQEWPVDWDFRSGFRCIRMERVA